MKYIIYTDGACAVSLMFGGYAAIVENESRERVVVTGSKVKATNNEMEILAVVQGINAIPNLKPQDEVKVYSDSAYVVNAVQQKWIANWIKNGWKTSTGKPVKNKKLWLRLAGMLERANIKLCKVKGHSGIPENEVADKLAVAEVKRLKTELGNIREEK